jgi:hypothetical protein
MQLHQLTHQSTEAACVQIAHAHAATHQLSVFLQRIAERKKKKRRKDYKN